MNARFEIAGETKYWDTKSGATRMMNKLFDEGDSTFWVQAWEDGKGWFLENLEQTIQLEAEGAN